MRFGSQGTIVLLVLALAGCSAAPAPSPTEDSVDALVKACGDATTINGVILDADYRYSVDKSITADEWLAQLAEAKDRAGELATTNGQKPYAGALDEYAAWVGGLSEEPPAEMTDRPYNEGGAPLLYSACEAGGATYGVTDGGAVGG